MLVMICVLWIGITLNAPTWFYVLLGLSAIIKTAQTGVKIGKNAK